jgi:glucose/mannose transport system substrate-binding protein
MGSPLRAGIRAAAAAVCLLAALGCRSPASDPNNARGTTKPIEVLTRWDGHEEADALEAMTREHRKRYPGDELVFSMSTSDISALEGKRLRARMYAGEAPEVFHSNIGKNHMQWVLPDGIDNRDAMVVPLDDVLRDEVSAWRKAIPGPLLDYLSYQGKLYGVPANIHVLNLLYYNKKIFAEHHLAVPTSIAELKMAGERLRAAGIPLIALGRKDEFPLPLLVFEAILVAQEGAAFYRDYFSGKLAPDDPAMRRTLETAIALFRYINADSGELSWFQAAELVKNGRAATTVMGDWASAAFQRGGIRPDSEIGEAPFPGSQGTLVFTSDVFSMAVGSKNPAGAKRLLATIGSVPGQKAINLAKGSLPARTDAIWEGFDAFRTRKEATLRNGQLVMALSGFVPARFYADVTAGLMEALEQRDAEPVLQVLRSRYALLKSR